MIVVDFDGTLTAKGADECHSIFRDCWPADYNSDDWWDATHAEIQLREAGKLTREELERRVRNSSIRLLPASVDLLRRAPCQVHIVSAGITDVIQIVLNIHGVGDRAQVHANDMCWSGDDVFDGFRGRYITTSNKAELVQLAVPSACRVVVVGDHPNDLTLCAGSDRVTVGIGAATGDVCAYELDASTVDTIITHVQPTLATRSAQEPRMGAGMASTK